ncbi:MAG: WD40/YVTN/BNR-like repeat-containing protein, partial [Chloroflexota bacterium]
TGTVEEREAQSQPTAEPTGAPRDTEPIENQMPSPNAQVGTPTAGTGDPAVRTDRERRRYIRPPTERQRGLVALAICVVFAGALLASMLLPGPASRAAPACSEGAVIGDAMVVADSSGAPHLFAITRPPISPNVAVGDEPGCEALWRSDDNGITWTTVFSSGTEAPLTVAADQVGGLYLLTQRLQFPLYLAGNLYRDGSPGVDGLWNRISPQGKYDVPNVAISDLLVGKDGILTALAENGNGGALLRSADGGTTWHSVIIPHLITAASVALQEPMLAVAPPTYTPGQPPGLASDDGGADWRPLGMLPDPPTATNLRAILTGNAPARALELDLVSSGAVTADHPVVRYTSLDGGYHWTRVTCGARPAPGCAPLARWARGNHVRYVVYHGQLWIAPFGKPWTVMPAALPERSDRVVRVLVTPGAKADQVYLVTLTGIWRLDDTKWVSVSTGLSLGPPPAVSS